MKTNPITIRSSAGATAGQPATAGHRALPAGLFRHPVSQRRLQSLLVLLPVLAMPAFAAVPVNNATSEGYGLSAKLTVANLPVLDTLKLGSQAGTAPPAYHPAAAGVNLNVNTVVLVATGVLTSNVSSTVDGLPGQRTTTASGRVNGLNLSLADTILTAPLVSLGGTTSVIGSQCQVQGDGVSSQVTGSATLTNVNLSVLGAVVALPVNPPPNSVVQVAGGVAGLTIYLNEQTPVTGTGGSTIACTALRIRLDSVSVAGIGLLSGDIKIGVSSATQSADTDGDGIPNYLDGDADGDGITNIVEIAQAPANGDSDGDGIPNYLDLDSDNDGINDVIEAGGVDANGDGRQDGTADADHDGIVDTVDTTQGGTALPTPDSDGDGAKDYLDLDSDNDGWADIIESGNALADLTLDGMADGTDADQDGILSPVDGSPAFGDSVFSLMIDTDGDGIPNYRDPSSNGPGTWDIATTALANTDLNNDGRIDDITDSDHDGIPNVADNKPGIFGGLGDSDGDGISDVDEGSGLIDTDGDGLPDSQDLDSDADGIPDAVEQANAIGVTFDTDGDGIPDRRDLDSDNDGINDVLEAGGVDANGDGRQDGTVDADHDGLIDTVDTTQGGTALPVPDTDGDGAKNYIDLDSDNDTISDLFESGSGATDANHDGMVDGLDTDGDGIRNEVDKLPTFGDANDSGPKNTDGTDTPDYIDPDSDNTGGTDIENAGHGDLDLDHDGDIDGPIVDPDHDGVDARVDTIPGIFGGTGGCFSAGILWQVEHFTVAELALPAISGWNSDADSDGISNALEYVLGTDPRTPSPMPDLVTSFNATTGLTIKLDRDSCVRAFVAVEYSTDLAAWTSTGPGIHYISDSPAQMIVNVTGDLIGSGSSATLGQRLFVRLKVTIP